MCGHVRGQAVWVCARACVCLSVHMQTPRLQRFCCCCCCRPGLLLLPPLQLRDYEARKAGGAAALAKGKAAAAISAGAFFVELEAEVRGSKQHCVCTGRGDRKGRNLTRSPDACLPCSCACALPQQPPSWPRAPCAWAS